MYLSTSVRSIHCSYVNSNKPWLRNFPPFISRTHAFLDMCQEQDNHYISYFTIGVKSFNGPWVAKLLKLLRSGMTVIKALSQRGTYYGLTCVPPKYLC